MKRNSILVCLTLAVALLASAPAQAQMSGAIFTTESACNGTNINIFSDKNDVYLDGGPQKEGAAGLPNGSYYVKVTQPDGTLLGYTTTAAVLVAGGEFATCYHLNTILVKASDLSPGYDDSSNGVYKVWISQNASFPNSASKTDNFKVASNGGGGGSTATIEVLKFYDADLDGEKGASEVYLDDWRVFISDGVLELVRYTPVSQLVTPGTYVVSEAFPLMPPTWLPTTDTSVEVTVASGGTATVEFGNVCLGAGGGRTLGFWHNKNGGKIITGPPALLGGVTALNLRKADGTLLGSVNLATFQSFLTSASATNMANMLSAQLAAMYLNVASGGVDGNALVYAPGTNSANALGFASINDLIDEADDLLASKGLILAGDDDRDYAEALKNALDKANNNLNFLQANPCSYTFADLP